MKRILLMRHGKAEAPSSGQRDFDRELAGRGREDAERIGKMLKRIGRIPEAIVASPAARAKQTAEVAAVAMGFSGELRWDRGLYGSSGDAWLDALRGLPSGVEIALVVAHSPGIGDAAALLCGAGPGAFDVPTAGLVVLVAPVDRWRELRDGTAAVRWFVRPKLVAALE